jgi:alcohol dehydrogenase class IV
MRQAAKPNAAHRSSTQPMPQPSLKAEPIVLGAWPKALHVERGGTARLGEFVARYGSRAFIICGKTAANGPLMERVRAGLGDRLAAVYDGVLPHTPMSTVVAATDALAASGADVVISVGGGSATDTAKAVAMYAAGNGVDPYRTDASVVRSGARNSLPSTIAPHIAVPTVPGAGNVLLPTAGILDEQTRQKMLFDDPGLVPKLSLLDAELLAYCGAELTAVTGVRSIVGAIEALYAKRRNPFSTGLALEAIRLMRGALPASIARPDDIDARETTMYAAVMGTLATMNAGVSAVHAAGLVIGGRYNIAHGIPHAILMAPVMRAFAPVLAPLLPQLTIALGAAGGEDAIAAFERISRDAGMPTRLRDIDVREADFTQIAEQSAALPIMTLTPRPVPTHEIRDWLVTTW